METKVKACHLRSLYQTVFSSWCFTSNNSYHTGRGVVVAWKPGNFNINVLRSTDQLIHYHAQPVSGSASFYCTFIYAYNESARRDKL